MQMLKAMCHLDLGNTEERGCDSSMPLRGTFAPLNPHLELSRACASSWVIHRKTQKPDDDSGGTSIRAASMKNIQPPMAKTQTRHCAGAIIAVPRGRQGPDPEKNQACNNKSFILHGSSIRRLCKNCRLPVNQRVLHCPHLFALLHHSGY